MELNLDTVSCVQLTWERYAVWNLPAEDMLCGTYLEKVSYVKFIWRGKFTWNISKERILPVTDMKRNIT